MKFDASRAFGVYAAVVTCAAFWFALAAAATGSTIRFEVIDVQRINVRETDGTHRSLSCVTHKGAHASALRVQADGAAAIEFLGANGAVTRTVSAN